MAIASNAGILNTEGLSLPQHPVVGIVSTEWNKPIIDELMAGCERVLHQHGVVQIRKITVPGAFELPFGCRMFLETPQHRGSLSFEQHCNAVIALGAVIRGGTPHFEYVSQAVTTGILELNLHATTPVIFGVLTLDTEAQAWERLGGIHGHKGEEAALTALKMMSLHEQHAAYISIQKRS